MNWCKTYKNSLKRNLPLKEYTSFKIGGPAKYFALPENIDGLKAILVWAKKSKIKVFIIGAGSNLLIPDKGVNGLVIKLGAKDFKKIFFRGNFLFAQAGGLLSGLISASKKRSLSGLEFLAGIPGSLGGALIMNSGAWGKSIGDLVENVTVMDYNGKLKELNKKEIKFSYRGCGLEKYIVLKATLRLKNKNAKNMHLVISEYLRQRRQKQDLGVACAGSIFKNPPGNYAGALIDACGLKGKASGGAVISEKHANFILNRKNAKYNDVMKLIRLAQRAVKNKFQINLKPEVKIW